MTLKRCLVPAVLLVSLALCLGDAGAATAAPLTLLTPAETPATVTLQRQEDGSLAGRLNLAIRSEVRATLDAFFYSGGGGEPGTVNLPSPLPQLKKKKVTETTLSFALPKGAAPEDLDGTVVLRARGRAGARLELKVVGAAPTLKGIAVQPEKVTIKLSSGWPFPDPSHTSTQIQLVGPGVPGLFAGGASPAFDLLLHSSANDTAHATLTDLRQSAEDPDLATATLNIRGDLGAGSFEGSAPIANASSEGPKLTVAVESGDCFVWAVLAVFLGAVIGGGLYLASNRKRRKNLLRDEVKALLTLYAKRMADFPKDEKGKPEVPVWPIDKFLGEDETKWYEVKTNAIVDFDGAVQTIWSAIHWARSEEDLVAIGEQVDELKTKIVRWITVANAALSLRTASRLAPTALPASPDKEWASLHTPKDTDKLLGEVRAIEPADTAATASTIDRLIRQARWHEVMAAAWNALLVIETAIAAPGAEYAEAQKKAIGEIGLAKIDEDASEPKRKAAEQSSCEVEVSEKVELIRKTFKGDPDELEPTWAKAAAEKNRLPLPQFLPAEQERMEPDPTEAERPDPKGFAALAASVRGPSATDHDGKRISPAYEQTLRRDLGWTVATALASAAVYVPTIFSNTWGTLPDYVGAFAAGFIGKAAISWAGLPFFESLSARGAATAAAPKKAA